MIAPSAPPVMQEGATGGGAPASEPSGPTTLVTRVELEAPTASFRFPHFLVGRQITYEMPPLATLYGLLCAAAGEFVDPTSLRLGLRFTYAAKTDDLEHQVIVSPSNGKMPSGGVKIPKALDGVVQPNKREFLFQPRLTLYVTGDWTVAFRAPRYTLSLGRSQDLAACVTVKTVALRAASAAYYEETLLPWRLRPAVLRARAETMPRYVDLAHGRQPHFDRFLILKERAFTTRPDHWTSLPDGPASHWVDPDSPEVEGAHRGVWLHPLRASES